MRSLYISLAAAMLLGACAGKGSAVRRQNRGRGRQCLVDRQTLNLNLSPVKKKSPAMTGDFSIIRQFKRPSLNRPMLPREHGPTLLQPLPWQARHPPRLWCALHPSNP